MHATSVALYITWTVDYARSSRVHAGYTDAVCTRLVSVVLSCKPTLRNRAKLHNDSSSSVYPYLQ